MMFMISDKLIKEKLSSKEARELIFLCRSIFPTKLSSIVSFEKYEEENDCIPENLKANTRIKRRVHTLYQKITTDEKEYMGHWYLSYEEQKKTHLSYKHNTSLERQDNKTFINTGSHHSNANKIRYPKKVRKTAWKRFYKLFPKLKPKEENLI
jgi:hypothetical protein